MDRRFSLDSTASAEEIRRLQASRDELEKKAERREIKEKGAKANAAASTCGRWSRYEAMARKVPLSALIHDHLAERLEVRARNDSTVETLTNSRSSGI
jgi:hypothetical protein